jgi:hypothetical protein
VPITFWTAAAASPQALEPDADFDVVAVAPAAVVGAAAPDVALDDVAGAAEVADADGNVDAGVWTVDAEDPHAASVSRNAPTTTERRLG